MYYLAQIVEFPTPSRPELIVLMLVFFAMFAIAVGFELTRRRQVMGLRLKAEWRTVERIIKERQFTEREVAALRDLLHHYGQDEPLSTVTTRHGFEIAVEAAMRGIEKKGNRQEAEELGIVLRDLRSQLGLDFVPLGQRITSTRELHAGQWMSITRASDPTPRWMRVMLDNIDEAYLYLTRKTSDNDGVSLPREGDEVRCRLWRDEDARYFFNTTTLMSDPANGTLRIAHTEDLHRSQAREHFRLRHDQSTTIALINAPQEESYENLRARTPVAKLRGRITSLSAGGCALVIQQSVSKRILLRILVELPEAPALELHAKVISCDPISGGRYVVRTTFVDIMDEERDLVAKHVMHKQQLLLASGEDGE